MPVCVLQRVMPAAEFTHWIAFAEIEPFGSRVDDWRMNMLRAPHIKDCKPVFASEVFGGSPVQGEEQTPEEQIAVLKAFNNGNQPSASRSENSR